LLMQNFANKSIDKELASIRGVLKRVTFRNSENGYSVLQLTIPDEREPVTLVGVCMDPKIGATFLAKGTFFEHPKFGRQFKAQLITEVPPTTADGIERYLSSGLIKGIGEKTAQRLVDTFGDQALEVIYQDPEQVAKIPGIGKSKAKLIHEAFAAKKDAQDTVRFLVEHGMSPNLAQKIYNQYRSQTIEVMSKDPYILSRQMKGIGFQTADKIALHLGIKPDSPQRLRAGLYYALEKASEDGHCYLPETELYKRAQILIGLEDAVDLSPHLAVLSQEGFINIRESNIYLQHLYTAEKFVADFVSGRLNVIENDVLGQEAIQNSIREAGQFLGLTFSFEQENAVHEAMQRQFMLITGGPGCGKTTVIRALAEVFKKSGKRLLLAAPTGRAAQRISQVCDYPASTIHRLLKYEPRTGKFLYGINEPLQTDVLIVDEASMIDISLAKDLFSAIGPSTKLILVGDKDQLPSVGPGKLFADLISTHPVKSINLSQLFRRSEESNINSVAHMINSGVMPTIPEPDGITKSDTYFLPKREATEAAQLVESLVSDQIPRKFGFTLSDISVLTPSHRGPLGTIELNRRLQARINPVERSGEDQQIEVGESIFRVGDRVCQRVNNYNIDTIGVFNGDLGQIYSVDKSTRKIVVELWDGRLITYEGSDLSQLALAYCVTVHRSQGSEIPCVVLVLNESHFTLLERQLIYTAITRAKKLLIIVGSKRALAMACKKVSSHKRCTYLRQLILEQHS
jgi:exodeoxyribonuclease V alpha subunit